MIRVRGVDRQGAWCKDCISGALPFVGIVSESEFKIALTEYRQGLQSRAGQFQGLRLDPFDDDIGEALKGLNATLKGCGYVTRDKMRENHKNMAKKGGCSLTLLCHNIRSAKGPGLELFEAELRTWGVPWNVIGLTETWLDEESEKRFSVEGYRAVCASRRKKGGGGVALLIEEGQAYRERPELGIF